MELHSLQIEIRKISHSSIRSEQPNERESDLTKRIHSRTEQIESGDSFGTNSRNEHSLIGIPVLEEGIAAFIGNMRRSLIGLIETRFWEGMGLLGRQKRAILYPSGVNYRLRGLEPWPWPYTFYTLKAGRNRSIARKNLLHPSPSLCK